METAAYPWRPTIRASESSIGKRMFKVDEMTPASGPTGTPPRGSNAPRAAALMDAHRSIHFPDSATDKAADSPTESTSYSANKA